MPNAGFILWSQILPKIIFKYSIFFLILFASINLCFAQTPAKAMNSGLEKFRAGNYSQALPLFRQASVVSPDNPYADEALFLTGKTLVRLERYTEASAVVDAFYRQFPASEYFEYVRLLKSEILFAKDDYHPAYIELIQLFTDCSNLTLKKYLQTKLDLLFTGMAQSELLYLQDKLDNNEKSVLDKYLGNNSSHTKIALVYHPDDSSAASIISGLQAALSLNQPKEKSDPYQLLFIELDGAPLQQYFQVKALSNQSVAAVVCLTTGVDALMNASAASDLKIPFYILKDDTPDLCKIAPNIWQLAPDLAYLGKSFADFAFKNLGLRRFATLAPLDDPRETLTETFIKEISDLGGEVAASEWYYTHSQDLGGSFKNIRRVGYKIDFSDSLKTLKSKNLLLFEKSEDYPIPTKNRIEAGDAFYTVDTLTASLIDKLWTHHLKKQRSLLRFNRAEIDSNDIAISCYHGFLFPFNQEEADMYINQFAFYNLKTDLLGLASSFNAEILAKHHSHLKNLIVASWNNGERNSDNYRRLNDIFISLKNRPPDQEEILGYDAMNFLLQILLNKNKARPSADKNISYTGINYNFNFSNGNRFNQSVNFFRFDGTNLMPIKPKNSLSEKK